MASIGIDCRFASSPTGLGTYTRNIAIGLTKELSDHHIVLFTGTGKQDWLKNVHGKPTLIAISARHYSLSEQIILPLRIKQASVDLLFSPHFNVPLLCPVPFVTTVHDLILHRYPNAASVLKRIAYLTVIGHAVRAARSVIAVSAFTGKEVSDVYGPSVQSKITVIPEGVDPAFHKLSQKDAEHVLRKHDLKPGFFLYVGNAKQHKNVQMLIDAHAKVLNPPVLVLITTGGESRLLKFGPTIRVLSGIPVEDLPAFYSSARAFVTASLYEGFCLPILEARACGCPVIAANTSAIPEVAGQGAALVAPSIDALTSALLHSPQTSEPPEAKYTWELAAKATAAILQNALHG